MSAEPPRENAQSSTSDPASTMARSAMMVVAGAALALVLAYAAGFRRESPVAEVEVQATRPALTAIRDLARLETVSFHLERVVDVRERQSTLFGLVDAQDAILLVAAADVRAGVDLSRLRDEDIEVDMATGHATLVLPAPEIFDSRLDNERTYVHTRETDTLARRSERLETTARRRAEEHLAEAAEESGILDRARENAESTLRALVQSLGYAEVEIRWQDGRGDVAPRHR